jgi:SAM-dependent methyltransferase
MQNGKSNLLHEVAAYYSKKLAQHGQTPQGVDWNGQESQVLRFEQLSKLIGGTEDFSLNDLGCGYGALFHFLKKKYRKFSYVGIDVSEAMIQAAMQYCQGDGRTRFAVSAAPDQIAEYGIASGIFNVRLKHSENEWHDYLTATLDVLDRTSRLGFAFNCLTLYSDEGKKRDYLYYADPCLLFDLCKKRYSKQVALLHDYGLYEFTIIVRKM